MRNYGLYIEFVKGVFTFIGGLKGYAFESNREPILSQDYSTNERRLIAESGRFSFSITGSLIFDSENLEEMYSKVFEANREGYLLKCRIAIPSGKVYTKGYEGSFILSNFSGNFPDKELATASITLQSSGKVIEVDL